MSVESPQKTVVANDASELRKKAGRWLRERRSELGFGHSFFTMTKKNSATKKKGNKELDAEKIKIR